MKLINFDEVTLPCFNVSKYVLDFDSIEYDDENIVIPFKENAKDNDRFKPIKAILEDRLRDFYQDELFDDSIDGEFSLVVLKVQDGYVYKTQLVTDNAYTDFQVSISKKEFTILKPYIDKAFKCSDNTDEFADIRLQVAKTFDGNVPKCVLDKLKLNSEKFFGKSYRSAWITDDNRSCVFANVKDYSKSDCPVEIVKFTC